MIFMETTYVKSIDEIYTIRGEKITVNAPTRFNSKTNEQVFDEELDNRAVNQALDVYRANHNVISPSRIKALRHKFGLNQRDFASLLAWSPTTIATYETGALPSKANDQFLKSLESDDSSFANRLYENTKCKMTERGRKTFEQSIRKSNPNKASDLIDKGINEYFADTNFTEYSGFSKFDLKKFTSMVLFFVNKVPKLTKTKLNKLMFYSDFKYFNDHTVSISGASYAKLPHGPVPNQYSLLYASMESANLIDEDVTSFQQYQWNYYQANKDTDHSLFNEDELATLNDVAEKFGNLSTKSVSEISHEEKAWLENETGQLISYEYATELSILNG